MKRMIVNSILALCFSASVAVAAVPEATVGTKAPEFSLVDQNGATHTLSQYAGKIVVLEWTNPECPFVKRHYKAGTMKKLEATYKSKGVIWLAVNSTHFVGPEKLKAWSTEQEISYPLLNDQDGTVGKAYGAKTTPHMFVVDKEGKLAYDGAIDTDLYGDESDSKNFVALALDNLIAGAPVSISSTTPYGCSVKYKS